jgi:hypothetical protein
VVELRGGRARIVARHPVLGLPAHNVVPDGDRLVANDSAQGRVLAVDRASGAIVRAVDLPGELPFPRGLLRLGDGRFAVGTQDPAAIRIVDLDAQRIDATIVLDDGPDESPYAIAPVPDGFADPSGRVPDTRAGWGIAGADASGTDGRPRSP